VRAWPASRERTLWTLGVSVARLKTCLVVRSLDADRERARREAEWLRARLGLGKRGSAARGFVKLHVFCFAGAEPWDPGLAGCVLAGVRRDGRPFEAEPLLRLPAEPGSEAAEVVRTALSGGDAPVEPGTSRAFLFASAEEVELREVERLELRRGSSVDVFVMREQPIVAWEEFLEDPSPGGPGTPTVANTPERR
jgi:hypothetical protein